MLLSILFRNIANSTLCETALSEVFLYVLIILNDTTKTLYKIVDIFHLQLIKMIAILATFVKRKVHFTDLEAPIYDNKA